MSSADLKHHDQRAPLARWWQRPWARWTALAAAFTWLGYDYSEFRDRVDSAENIAAYATNETEELKGRVDDLESELSDAKDEIETLKRKLVLLSLR